MIEHQCARSAALAGRQLSTQRAWPSTHATEAKCARLCPRVCLACALVVALGLAVFLRTDSHTRHLRADAAINLNRVTSHVLLEGSRRFFLVRPVLYLPARDSWRLQCRCRRAPLLLLSCSSPSDVTSPLLSQGRDDDVPRKPMPAEPTQTPA